MGDKLQIVPHKKYCISEIECIVNDIINKYEKRKPYNEYTIIKSELSWKNFKDEILPIFQVAKFLGATEVCFSAGDNTHYDGIIFVNGVEQYVECTTAIDYEKNDIVRKILKSGENDSIIIPAGYTAKDLKESVKYITKNHKISKQIEPDFESGIIKEDNILDKWKGRIGCKVIKGRMKNLYSNYILILTVDSPMIPVCLDFRKIYTFWNKIRENPFAKLFIFETREESSNCSLICRVDEDNNS